MDADARRRRRTARTAGIVWLLAAAYVAVRNGSRPTTRDIGAGVTADCGRVFASQLAQLVLAAAGGTLLIGAADRDAPPPAKVGAAAAALLVAWILAATLLPTAFAWDCVN
jgi:hypothetical protein